MNNNNSKTIVWDNIPEWAMSVDWESYNEFDTNPAFGKACKTYKVTFCIL